MASINGFLNNILYPKLRNEISVPIFTKARLQVQPAATPVDHPWKHQHIIAIDIMVFDISDEMQWSRQPAFMQDAPG